MSTSSPALDLPVEVLVRPESNGHLASLDACASPLIKGWINSSHCNESDLHVLSVSVYRELKPEGQSLNSKFVRLLALANPCLPVAGAHFR